MINHTSLYFNYNNLICYLEEFNIYLPGNKPYENDNNLKQKMFVFTLSGVYFWIDNWHGRNLTSLWIPHLCYTYEAYSKSTDMNRAKLSSCCQFHTYSQTNELFQICINHFSKSVSMIKIIIIVYKTRYWAYWKQI